jgi:hypothetical protein
MEERWRPEIRHEEGKGQVVDFGPGFVIEAEGKFPVANKALPYDLEITYGFDGERFQVTAATFLQRPKGAPVRSDLVRKVPLERVLREHLGPRHLPRTGRRLIVRQAKLLAVYRTAWACHVPPTQAVAGHFGITTAAAEQRVFAARAAGLLPATEMGKARGSWQASTE